MTVLILYMNLYVIYLVLSLYDVLFNNLKVIK